MASAMLERLGAIIDPEAFNPLHGHEECPLCVQNKNDALALARKLVEALMEPDEEMTGGCVFYSGGTDMAPILYRGLLKRVLW